MITKVILLLNQFIIYYFPRKDFYLQNIWILKIHCFSVYKLHDLQETISCSDDFEIATDKTVRRTKEVCEDQCTQHKSCQYYGYTNDNLCTLYAECNIDNTKHETGNTYEKPSNYSTRIKPNWLLFKTLNNKCNVK